jgi:energy-coupling factor transporter ATP-binding protein EcfA2
MRSGKRASGGLTASCRGTEFTLEKLKQAASVGYDLPYPRLQDMTLGLRKGELTLLTAGSGIGKSRGRGSLAYMLHQRTAAQSATCSWRRTTPRRRRLTSPFTTTCRLGGCARTRPSSATNAGRRAGQDRPPAHVVLQPLRLAGQRQPDREAALSCERLQGGLHHPGSHQHRDERHGKQPKASARTLIF